MKTDLVSSCSGSQAIVGRNDGLTNLQWWVGCKTGGQPVFSLVDNTGNKAGLIGTKDLIHGFPHSIWGTGVSVGPESQPSNGVQVELGVKFRADVDGYVTGIRFYKYPLNTGTHTGNLWTMSGTNLGTVTFSNETASGWQEARFAAPIPITANTTYIISYYTASGHFARSEGFFSSTGVDNQPLHLLRSGVDGVNGVYKLSTTTVFPDQPSSDNYYWMDAVFEPRESMWHHIVAVRDAVANEIRLYTDGVKEASQVTSYQSGFDSAAASLNIGTMGGVYPFQGIVDEVALYNRALTGGEIRSHYYLARGYCDLCANPVRIMPLGDSITYGVGTGGNVAAYMTGYRQPLNLSLANSGYNTDFVGSLQAGQSATPSFDYNHEGHAGYTSSQVASQVNTWLVNNPADVVLLHIGTNDLDMQNPSTDPSNVESILNEIDRYDQRITVMLARIIDTVPYSAATTTFNNNVQAMAQNRIANGDKIIMVNEESALDYSVDMWDNLHPNQSGYNKMANIWMNALSNFMPATFLPVCGGQPAPVITSTPVTSAVVGQPYSYDVNASGNPAPGYSLIGTPPSGMVIDPITGLIQWTPTSEGPFDVTVEAFNTAGSKLQSFTINVAPAIIEYSVWGPGVTVGPEYLDSSALELGVKFRADADGSITGLRFYKYPLNSGTHTGNLWTMSGANLGRVTFTNETASGWQEARFAAPIPITANTTYIISYHTTSGHFARSAGFFTSTGVDSPPLHLLRSGVDGVNGVYSLSQTTTFPDQPSSANYYWVDVLFEYNNTPVVPVITSAPVTSAVAGQPYMYDVNASGNPAPGYRLVLAPSGMVIDGTSGLIQWTPSAEGPFNVTVEAFNTAGSGLQSFTINVAPASSEYSVWSPGVTVGPESQPGNGVQVELGVKFRADADGSITGIRFYKYPLNTGTHIGNLWTTGGVNLGRVTFTNETASGWQEARFAAPIAITANTTYIISYYTASGHFARSAGFFTSTGVDNPPLHLLRSGVDGVNGVYGDSPTTVFPSQPSSDNYYWVDVVFAYNNSPVAPVIISAPVTSAVVGKPYTYDVNASGNPAPGYRLVSAPSGMVIDGTSGLIQWTPSAEGPFNVTVEAFNTAGSNLQSFTINVAPASTEISVWGPGVTVGPEAQPINGVQVELGVKFRADINGSITGLRFYKYPLNTGTHIGNLWTTSGVNLGRVTFTNETASGWQEARFAAPIPITANTTYIISYYTTSGHFARSAGFFTSTGVDAPPLHLLRSGVDGVNGVYGDSPTTVFPSQPSSDNYYWVDVLFK